MHRAAKIMPQRALSHALENRVPLRTRQTCSRSTEKVGVGVGVRKEQHIRLRTDSSRTLSLLLLRRNRNQNQVAGSGAAHGLLPLLLTLRIGCYRDSRSEILIASASRRTMHRSCGTQQMILTALSSRKTRPKMMPRVMERMLPASALTVVGEQKAVVVPAAKTKMTRRRVRRMTRAKDMIIGTWQCIGFLWDAIIRNQKRMRQMPAAVSCSQRKKKKRKATVNMM